MPKYAIKIGEMHLTADFPVTSELRAAILEAVQDAFKNFDAGLGVDGLELVFRVEKT